MHHYLKNLEKLPEELLTVAQNEGIIRVEIIEKINYKLYLLKKLGPPGYPIMEKHSKMNQKKLDERTHGKLLMT